jgi:hypothetical protein
LRGIGISIVKPFLLYFGSMGLYSSSNFDILVRDEIRANLGQPVQAAATNPTVTDRGLIGLTKGVWQTLLDRLPPLSGGALPVTITGSGTISSIPVTTVAVTTASAVLLPANVNRLGILIYNPLTNTANTFINFGATATVAEGLIIPPGYERQPDFNWTGVISVIGSANHSVIVRELVRA